MKRTHDLWDPFRILEDFQHDINRVFDRSLQRKGRWDLGFQPDIEVREEDDRYLVSADLPGFKKEDIKLTVDGNTLTLKGERKSHKEVKEKGRYFSERTYGSFQRSVDFPTELQGDKVQAAYKDGVLDITLPKSEHAKRKQIDIKVQ